MSTDFAGNNQPKLLPLTGAQRNVWFHQLIDPNSIAYNIGQIIRISGAISTDLFIQAQNQVWQTSESLRVRFVVVKGEPFQEILDSGDAPFEQTDLRSAVNIDQALKDAIEEHQLRPHHLATGPCCRFALFQIEDEKWVWSMAVHHLAVDAPGGSYLTTLLAQTYKKLATDPVTIEMPEMHDWAQAIEADRDYQTGERYQKDKEYWLNTTAGLTTPPSFSIQPVNTLNLVVPENAFHFIPRDTYEKFANWSVSNGQSLYSGFAAAFSIYLSRLTGESDICIGSPTSGRNKKTRGLIGMLSNAIALRLQINHSDSVLDVLHKTARQNRQNLRHNSFPIGELTQERRKQGYSSAFSLVVNLLVFDQLLDFGDASGAVETLSTGSVADLQLNIFDRTDGSQVELRMDFNPARYKQEEIQSHLERLGHLINTLPELEQAPIASLPILKNEEKNLLVAKSAGPLKSRSADTENNLIAQFYASAKHHAQAQALHYVENEQNFFISYDTLNQRSNQLARYLLSHGVKTDQVIAVLMDRSVDQIVSMLAIMKAGAAYLPIDPEYPHVRQAYMLTDSQAYAVISTAKLLDAGGSLFKAIAAKNILLDDELTQAEVSRQSANDLSADELSEPLRPWNLAYLIYTSGSTGMPKGAGNTHEAILNRLEWMQDTLDLQQQDRVLQKTGLGFDVAVWEWFLPLMTGSSLVISSPQGHKDPVYLKEMIERFQITVLHFVPSMLSVFLKFLSAGDCPSIRQIVTSGEALSAELQDETLGKYPELKLWNLYGPTEAAIDVSVWQCTLGKNSSTPPIGLPIWNTQLYILDSSLQLAPAGAIGELYIAGTGLARGYLGRSGLTAERFIACPFTSSCATGSRMYRTGDLAYMRDDGAIMYVGRADNQIKIRGFRVELGEIESSIKQSFKNLSQVIVIDQMIHQEQTLVCYVVPGQDGLIPEISELQNRLSLSMPAYMLPSYIVSLNALPLTANGKLDRKALPKPTAGINGSTAEYVAPDTTQEIYLCQLFAELTGKESVSVLDNFFAIGGHSLLAMRLISNVKDSLGVLLPLKIVFDFPTSRALSPHLAQLSQDKSSALLAGQGTKPDQSLFLSYGQERLWTLNQVEGASATYNMPSLIGLKAQLDVEALTRAINLLVIRHAPLRTVIGTDENSLPKGKLLSAEQSKVKIEIIETSASRLEALAKAESAQTFDLGNQPSIRIVLFTENSQQLALLITFHHQACDGVSREIFFKELDCAYSAFAQGLSPSLPVNPVSYADWAYWQKENISNELSEKIQRAQQRLENMPELLTLPLDFARSADRLRTAGYVNTALPNTLVVQLESIATRLNTTLFSVLLGAYALTLHKIAGQNQVVIGVPASGRTHTQTAHLMGMFVNMLPVPFELSASDTTGDLILQTRKIVQEVLNDQDLPFERLLEDLHTNRSLDYSPVFQTMFAYQNSTALALTLNDAAASLREVELPTAKYDLSLFISLDRERALQCNFEFDADLFKYENVDSWTKCFTTVLNNLAHSSDLPLAELAYYDDQQFKSLLAGSLVAAASNKIDNLLDVFGDCVKKFAHSTAITFPEHDKLQTLSYLELELRSNQLANLLRERAIGEQDVVAILLDRTHEIIISMLACLKTGAAYLPLDPEFPVNRIGYMLEDSNAQLLLCSSQHQEVLNTISTGSTTTPVLELDNPSVLLALNNASTLFERAEGAGPTNQDHLAYLLYTSGSTGKPKGVGISRKALSLFLASVQTTLQIKPAHRVLALTTIGFDISGLEIFLPLMHGAEIVLLNAQDSHDPHAIIRTINSLAATHIQATPSLLSAVQIEAASTPIQQSLHFLSGGEALPKHLASSLLSLGKVTNLYGPTEATIWASFYELSTSHITSETLSSAPIGKPLPGYGIYVLDSNLKPVPDGVVGELYISGEALSRGYYGRPGLTAERFIACPFESTQDAGQRMYRTGDLARRHHDGNIEYLGRADDQVKIRGHRIELGEIEAALMSTFGIFSQVVVVAKMLGQEQHLVAYLVTDFDHEMPEQNILKTELQKHIPEYMIPSYFMELMALPLTPNGKINRLALPEPTVTSAQYRAPETAIEKTLCGLFSELTKTTYVGLDDNFFSIGGHSLLAMRLITRIRQDLGASLPLRDLFKFPTPAGMVTQIQSVQTNQENRIKAGSGRISENEVTLSFGQKRLWALNQLDANSNTYNVPAAILIKGSLNVEALGKTLVKITARHESLRTVITEGQQGDPVGKLLAPLTAEELMPVRDLTRIYGLQTTQGKKDFIQELIQSENAKSFDLSQDRPFRAELILLGTDETLFLITLHHHASDGGSAEVLIREIREGYIAYLEGREPNWPALNFQYSDWAYWQEHVQQQNWQEKIDRNKERLAGIPELLTLPEDFSREANRYKTAGYEPVSISSKLTSGLQSLAKAESTTLFTVILAVYGALLARLAKQETVVIGSPVEGHTSHEMEGVVGFLVNTLVYPVSIGQAISGRNLIRATKAMVETTLVDQDLPFEQLVENLNVSRSLLHTPVFQAMLAFQNKDDSAIVFGDLASQRIFSAPPSAKFDLTLSIWLNEAGELHGQFEYDANLFEKHSVTRWAQYLNRLIESFISDAEQPVLTLELSDSATTQQNLLASQGANEKLPASFTSLPSAFAAQVLEHPENIALAYAVNGLEQTMTYSELDKKSNQLARMLIQRGIRRGQTVGILLHRSAEMMAGILAILKTGAAYLPLDMSYPSERLSHMLTDSQANITLSTTELIEKILSKTSDYLGHCLALDSAEILEEIHSCSDDVLSSVHSAENIDYNDIVYVMYTSGSTGKPKGVGFLHGSLMNLVYWQQQTLPKLGERVLQYSPIGFDASAQEIAATLSRGATLVLVDEETRKDSRALLQHIEKHRVDDLFAPFVVLNNLALAKKNFSMSAWPKSIFTAGEQLQINPELREAFLAHPASRLYNFYGPTEAHVVSNFSLPDDPQTWELLPPIGYPIWNNQLYILDPSLNLTPEGSVGELYLAGDGLARAYINRPGLTAERFIACPFLNGESGVRETRMYRTGDLARRRKDGSIEFLGRADEQVKIRGYRIELGEIEATILTKFPQIRQLAVIAREELGDKKLVAYLVPEKDNTAPSASEIRSALAVDLPHYMIPNDYVVLEALPLSSHGKLDKRALPAPDQAENLTDYHPPTNEREQLLCNLFAEITSVERVGIHDNFFAIGGHSLLAMKLIARIRQKTDKTVSLRSIFELTTPEMIATILDEKESDDAMQLMSGLGRIDEDD